MATCEHASLNIPSVMAITFDFKHTLLDISFERQMHCCLECIFGMQRAFFEITTAQSYRMSPLRSSNSPIFGEFAQLFQVMESCPLPQFLDSLQVKNVADSASAVIKYTDEKLGVKIALTKLAAGDAALKDTGYALPKEI